MTPAEFASRFPRAADVVQHGMERQLHHGAQIYVSLHGDVLSDVGLGSSSPGVPMTADTINPWLSAGKPLMAALLSQWQEAGELDWDDTVARHIPEFGGQGKDAITIRHLLTHTAGLGSLDAGWPEVDWNESLRQICTGTFDPQWVIGESAGYDPGCSWFLLGEIAQRISGKSFHDVLADRVLRPFGLNHTWAALSPAEHLSLRPRLGWMWERQQGQLIPTDWHEAPRCTRPSPGSSLRGPIRELGRFYESLFSRERCSRSLTAPQRTGRFDQTFGHIVDFGLGVLLDSNRYGADTVPYGYGRFCSPRTFGHGGSQCSQGYCDPEIGLVVAYVFNGRPGEGQHQRRLRAFNEAVYADLGTEGA